MGENYVLIRRSAQQSARGPQSIKEQREKKKNGEMQHRRMKGKMDSEGQEGKTQRVSERMKTERIQKWGQAVKVPEMKTYPCTIKWFTKIYSNFKYEQQKKG